MSGLMDTTDASIWASEFCRIFDKHLIFAGGKEKSDDPVVDEGTMIAWFANAIELGRTTGRRETCPHLDFHVVSEEMKLCNVCGFAVYGEDDLRDEPFATEADALDAHHAYMLIRAKGNELEHVAADLMPEEDDPYGLAYVIADLGLVFQLLADHIRRTES